MVSVPYYQTMSKVLCHFNKWHIPCCMAAVLSYNKDMTNNKLKPMFNGAVLMNETAIQDKAVMQALTAMSKRNFEPQRLNAYGVWYISDRH